MNVQHLRYFLAVMQAGSVSRAAGELGITQPTLSQALKGLEREFGAPLFAPDGRGIRALPSAKRLEAKVRTALQTLAEAKRELTSPAPARLKLGVLPSIAADWLPKLLPADDGVIELIEAPADELEKLVASGGLDLALSIAPHRNLHRKLLLSEPFQLFVGPDHPWSGRRTVALAELNGQPFVLRQGCERVGTGRRLLSTAGVRFRIVAKTRQESTAAALVAAGLGCTLAPASWGDANVRALDVGGLTLQRDVSLIWKQATGAKAAAKLAARLQVRA
ncbi:LysR family transcriptional regulator [Rhodopseudomonas thermotolerans]|uniref:LysR family transcriptional regulator n=2 Tax=Rhodopseudomonas TaxID=1073 RepID=A0A336JQL6_9BRAD|nr:MULTISPECIES: LysR family transcriptional regulator [Rhodopseudomonas]RED31850.1 LysR family transcriptional regulator [Rhodopseudomonas pentothenatexigens]REF93151.1 LysR family transcriptional regulator [Rhodopseudomonas thermotolerans]SSW91830.1 LysR family transcriptional regulator [Rhodopseudomonas pentothenatexigens]